MFLQMGNKGRAAFDTDETGLIARHTDESKHALNDNSRKGTGSYRHESGPPGDDENTKKGLQKTLHNDECHI